MKLYPVPNAESPQPDIDFSTNQKFNVFYEQTHRIVFRYISGIYQAPIEEIEDLTAETFIKAWKARNRFTGPAQAATSWLLKIAKNLVIDQFRKNKVQTLPIDLASDHLASDHINYEHIIDQKDDINKLFSLMDDIKPHHKEMLVLRYMLGWRVKEIAAHLEMEENTISVNIRRVLERLRQNWSDE